jgi:hypothetical protein
MAAAPFGYCRGAAYAMAAGLSSVPHSGLEVQLCGDAHLMNFGGSASPERDHIFDVNDFDETNPGPFEWDVKRLAASFEIVARSSGFDAPTRTRIVAESVRSYREAIREFAGKRHLEIWYSYLDAEEIIARWGTTAGAAFVANFQRVVRKAQTKDRLRAAAKLTHEIDGEMRFLSEPPLIVPVEEVFSELDARLIYTMILDVLRSYRHSLTADRRYLLDTHRLGTWHEKSSAWVVSGPTAGSRSCSDATIAIR